MNQIKTWELLRQAISEYKPNKVAIAKDASAGKALSRLEEILAAPSPYGMLHDVSGLVVAVKTVNDKLVKDARDKAKSGIDKKIGDSI